MATGFRVVLHGGKCDLFRNIFFKKQVLKNIKLSFIL